MQRAKTAVVVMCLLIVPFTAAAQTAWRNIFTFSAIDYDGIGTSRVYDNTTLVKMHRKASLVMKVYHDNRSDWHNNVGTLGGVFVLGDHTYSEITYGYGMDADDKRSDHYSADITREMPGYLAGLGLKHVQYPSFHYTVLSPYGRYNLTPRIQLWAKYFASSDSEGALDQSLWADIGLRATDTVSLRTGFTRGNRLYSPEYESFLGQQAEVGFYSLFGQVSYSPTTALTVKVHYEVLTRNGEGTDTKNSVIVDYRW